MRYPGLSNGTFKMHGVKRSDISFTDNEKISNEELQKIESYKLLVSQFTELYNVKDKTCEKWANNMMDCSINLLIKNPEYYTAWNERKRAILIKCTLPDFPSLLKQELMINVLAIKANPKSYCTWYHRKWFIGKFCEDIREDVAKEELKLLSQLLDLDCRNFHGWNYRIWLADWGKFSIIDEFDFTTLKIYQNFSNYSAWQRRANLLSKHLETFENSREIESMLRNEVEMCRNAAWTEPADQSIWFYQRWLFKELSKLISKDYEGLLMNLARDQVKSICELIEEEKRSSSVALAMSFIRFINVEVLKEENDSRTEGYLQCLKEVDQLRTNYWQKD